MTDESGILCLGINGDRQLSLHLDDLSERELCGLSAPMFEGYLPRYPDYNRYSWAEGNEAMFGPVWGPKEAYNNSVCKLRAYYHDINVGGQLVTIMYDMTGFLVGDSLLMTAAHGLLQDVTIGDFDDGVVNLSYPSKLEVYGAIGLGDVWGDAYPFYAEAVEIYLDSEYAISGMLKDDWSIVRLDRPLGRELSYRVLCVGSLPDDEITIIGYPYFNQFHFRTTPTNTCFNSSQGVYYYNATTFDGMSGSPCVSTEGVAINQYVDTFISNRSTSFMHVAYNATTNLCIGVKFTHRIVSLVQIMNERYRPETIHFHERIQTEAFLDNGEFSVTKDYGCNIESTGVTIFDESLVFGADSQSSFLTISFDFPVSSVGFSLNTYNSGEIRNFTYCITDFYCNSSWDYLIYNGVVQIEYGADFIIDFSEPIKEICFLMEGSIRSTATVNDLYFRPQWDWLPVSQDAPDFVYNEIPSNDTSANCISYAFNIYPETGPFIAGHTSSPNTQQSDLFPGNVLQLLKDDCLAYGFSLMPISKYSLSSSGRYKVALLCDPGRYYHGLRENNDGTWSHFLLGVGVKKTDCSGFSIIEPDRANFVLLNPPCYTVKGELKGETPFDLTSFMGYFSIGATNYA